MRASPLLTSRTWDYPDHVPVNRRLSIDSGSDTLMVEAGPSRNGSSGFGNGFEGPRPSRNAADALNDLSIHSTS
jgi:hypothetical protein